MDSGPARQQRDDEFIGHCIQQWGTLISLPGLLCPHSVQRAGPNSAGMLFQVLAVITSDLGIPWDNVWCSHLSYTLAQCPPAPQTHSLRSKQWPLRQSGESLHFSQNGEPWEGLGKGSLQLTTSRPSRDTAVN